MLCSVAPGAALAATAPVLSSAESGARKRIGIGMHSYGAYWKAAKEKSPGVKFSDALEFLRYARQLGAGGVQASIGAKDAAFAGQLRAEAENAGMYFEAQAGLPRRDSDVMQFETDVRLAKEAGAGVMRTALLSGRRYETFDSAEAFQAFREQSWQSLTLAEPILKRHRLRLAVENHKDWLVSELLEWLRKISSEWIGVCVDFGNSIALLENAMEVIEACAPFAATTHIKDMAVQEYEEGFLLSEVPLGEGFLDLPKMIEVLLKANPKIQFNLEMITRDPLRIPCLTPKFWVTMPGAPAQRLALALANVRHHAAKERLPHTTGLSAPVQMKLEDDNVRKSLAYARSRLSL